MLEKLFTSRVRVNLLKVLLFENRQFRLRELARRVEVTPVYVKKELDNLISVGLVFRTKKANSVDYSINGKSPIFEDFKNLFVKIDYIGAHLIKSFIFLFDKFRKKRHLAIYGIGEVISEEECGNCIKICEDFMRKTKEILENGNKVFAIFLLTGSVGFAGAGEFDVRNSSNIVQSCFLRKETTGISGLGGRARLLNSPTGNLTLLKRGTYIIRI